MALRGVAMPESLIRPLIRILPDAEQSLARPMPGSTAGDTGSRLFSEIALR